MYQVEYEKHGYCVDGKICFNEEHAERVADELNRLRDSFAMAALQGLLSDGYAGWSKEDMAVDAYLYADAMMEAR